MRPMQVARAGAGAAALLLSACLSHNPPEPTRWFLPVPPAADAAAAAKSGAAAAASVRRPLQLARVTASPHLDQRMVWRSSDVEFGIDEQNRWLVPPALLAEDALSRALFVEGSFTRTGALDAPIVEARVVHFEEVTERSPSVHVELEVVLARSRDGTMVAHRARAVRPLGGSGPDETARAIGAALHDAAAEVAGWLRGAVAGR